MNVRSISLPEQAPDGLAAQIARFTYDIEDRRHNKPGTEHLLVEASNLRTFLKRVRCIEHEVSAFNTQLRRDRAELWDTKQARANHHSKVKISILQSLMNRLQQRQVSRYGGSDFPPDRRYFTPSYRLPGLRKWTSNHDPGYVLSEEGSTGPPDTFAPFAVLDIFLDIDRNLQQWDLTLEYSREHHNDGHLPDYYQNIARAKESDTIVHVSRTDISNVTALRLTSPGSGLAQYSPSSQPTSLTDQCHDTSPSRDLASHS